MNKKNSNKIWESINELGEVLQKGYSVTDDEIIKKQYLAQVKQYPLYFSWFNKIEKIINNQNKKVRILEYGSGPGFLTERLVKNKMVEEYIVVEPSKTFRGMTKKKAGSKVKIINKIAEEYTQKDYFDIIISKATYHHFYDKSKAIKNFHYNLKKDGLLIIAEMFIPEYKFDKHYNSLNKVEFVENVLKYVSAQILAMPQPREEEIADQIRTAFMDILRIEELKVCLPILLDQLSRNNFKNVKSVLMKGDNKKINYKNLGYHFITAKK